MTDWDNMTTVQGPGARTRPRTEADAYWQGLDPEHRKAVEQEMTEIEGKHITLSVWDPVLLELGHPELLDRWAEIALAVRRTSGEPSVQSLAAWFQCAGHQEVMLALCAAYGPQPLPSLAEVLSAVELVLAVPLRHWDWSWDRELVKDAHRLWAKAMQMRSEIWSSLDRREHDASFRPELSGPIAEAWDPILAAITKMHETGTDRGGSLQRTLGLWRSLALQAGHVQPQVLAAWFATPFLPEPDGWRQWASYGGATRDAALACLVESQGGRLSSNHYDLVEACALVARLAQWAMGAGYGLLAAALIFEGERMSARLVEVW